MGESCKVLRVELEKFLKTCLTFLHTPSGLCLDAQLVLIPRSCESHFLVIRGSALLFPNASDLLCSVFCRHDFFLL